jgi:hypothetical protein
LGFPWALATPAELARSSNERSQVARWRVFERSPLWRLALGKAARMNRDGLLVGFSVGARDWMLERSQVARWRVFERSPLRRLALVLPRRWGRPRE